MKQLFLASWLALLGALSTSAATSPIYINDAGVISPPDPTPVIDATAWVNRNTNVIVTSSSFGVPLPFESQHTRFFTNTSGGYMIGDPGYRWYYNVGPQRLWMDYWTNNGTIITDHQSFFGLGVGIGFADSQASVLMVHATNIASTGPLRSGQQGLIYLEGNNINVRHTGLHTGFTPQTNLFFGNSFLLSSNYVDDFGISDVWWGAGTNNHLDAKGPPMRVDNLGNFPSFTLPFPETAQHQVIETFQGGGFPFTNTVILPQFNFDNYGAVAWTNQTSPSNFVVQVVFYPTNNVDTNFSTSVEFVPDASGASIVVVTFSSLEYDIVDQAYNLNNIFLSDALATVTNVFLANNGSGATSRPDTYEISRNSPLGFGFFGFGSPGNAVYSPSLLWNPTYQYNTVTNLYAAYQAQISFLNATALIDSDPTNFPGRINILGQEVNLDKTRIRAESALNLKVTKNLTSNRVAQVDAPWINFDVASLAPSLVISNIAPTTVRRLSGNIACWSATWNNNVTNLPVPTTTLFHVLLVDPALVGIQPVVMNNFAAHATNVVISDVLTIGQSFVADGQALDVQGGVFMPAGASWGATNLHNIVCFTNDGTINILKADLAGYDRPNPYYNYINRGTNTASTHFIRTTNFDNSGSIIASGGLLQVDTLTGRLGGNPLTILTNVGTNFIFVITNGFFTNIAVVSTNVITNSFGGLLQGNSDIQIFARDLVLSNSFLQAGTINQGTLRLSVTNSLTDSGQGAINHWLGTAGFEMLTLPGTSGLLATWLESRASTSFQDAFHVWCAQDLGPFVAGYNNNLGLGKLTLDGAGDTVFHFAAPAGQTGKALYVDYLELRNFATNYNSGALDISPDITIYFANANLNPTKLDGSNGGRLRWVQNFTGPLSSTNITYPSGITYTFNTALCQSLDIDSDGDGIVNGLDPTPLPEPETVKVGVFVSALPVPQAHLSWFAPANSTSIVEYNSTLSPTNWHVLTNVVNGAVKGTMHAVDNVPSTGKRLYRIRVDLH